MSYAMMALVLFYMGSIERRFRIITRTEIDGRRRPTMRLKLQTTVAHFSLSSEEGNSWGQNEAP